MSEFEEALTSAAAAMRNFSDAWQAGVDSEVAQHPDLAELNVMLDGFYGPPA